MFQSCLEIRMEKISAHVIVHLVNSEVKHQPAHNLQWNPTQALISYAAWTLTEMTSTRLRYFATPCFWCSCVVQCLQVTHKKKSPPWHLSHKSFQGLTLPLWRLATQLLQTDTGAYKVMLSLNMILSTGQGLLVFSVFILDCDYILTPVKNAGVWIKEKIKGEKENFPVLSAFLPDWE